MLCKMVHMNVENNGKVSPTNARNNSPPPQKKNPHKKPQINKKKIQKQYKNKQSPQNPFG